MKNSKVESCRRGDTLEPPPLRGISGHCTKVTLACVFLEKMTDERFENLSEELKAKALACKTPEEILELAKSEGVELSIDDLEGAAGGRDWTECEQDTNSGPY